MKRNYVFVVQDFDKSSQGNIIMHRLCHYLNEQGYPAYMAVKHTNPKWNTPIATREVLSENTIVVYTDVVPNNTMRATRVVRWLMNSPEFYKKTMKWQWWRPYDNGDIVFTFHKAWAPDKPVLYMREIDRDIFYKGKEKRKGIVYYVGKAKGKVVVPDYVKKGIELKTGKVVYPGSHEELANLFRKAEVFYCYVGSGLVEEAIYCGCPVIYKGEDPCTNWNGVAKDESDLERAIETQDARIKQVEDSKIETQKQIDEFIKITQAPQNPKKTVVLDLDDWSLEVNGFEYLFALKKLYPKLKVSLFTIPFDYEHFKSMFDYQREEVIKTLKENSDWIEIIPHGLTHKEGEFLTANYNAVKVALHAVNEIFKKQGIKYAKGFKAPFWQYSQAVIEVLDEMGWFMATDRNTPHNGKTKKYYEYTHGIEEEFWKYTDMPVWRLHGHMTPPSENNLAACMVNLSHIPQDAEFDFVSNHLYTL